MTDDRHRILADALHKVNVAVLLAASEADADPRLRAAALKALDDLRAYISADPDPLADFLPPAVDGADGVSGYR